MADTCGRTLRPSSRARLLATAVFLGAAGFSLAPLAPAVAQSFAFSGVTVEGNNRVDTTTILSYAGIGRGGAVSASDLNDAYQRLARTGLFETVELVPQGNTLLIKVTEYPFVNIINFEGNKVLKDEELAAAIQSQSRKPFSPATAESDAAAIAEIYRIRGRLAASVTPKVIRRDGNRVDLVFEIAEGKVVEIERLSFVGNRAFSDRRLRQVLETKQAGFLRALIQRDSFVAERLEVDKQMLTDFYRSRGYIDFQVTDATAETSRERDASFVTFTISEGLPYTFGQITTVSEIEGVDVAEFAALQKIRAGQTFNPAAIENIIARMENLALKKGLNFVRIDPRITRNDRGQAVNVEFALVRGERIFVERIDIEGNATTLDQVVRRQFRTVEGDPFNAREIRQSAERIRALGFFGDAKVNAEQGSSPDQVVVNVDVQEQPTGSLGFGLSYSVASGTGFNVNFSERNFLGRGQAIALSLANTSDTQNSSFSFTEPSVLGRDLSFNINGYYRTSDNDNALYNTRNVGFGFGLGFPVGEQSRLDLTYRLSKDRIFDYDMNDTTGLPNADSSPILRAELAQGDNGALITSALGYRYNFDNRITGLNPNTSYVLRFGQEISGLGGDTKFLSTTAMAMAEKRVWNEEVTVRAIFEGGYVHGFSGSTTRVTERYFGNGKIRGFEPNGIGPRDGGPTGDRDALGGNAFAVARFEADFPIGLPEEYGMTGGAFLDVGSVWSLSNTDGVLGAGSVDDSFKPRVSVGLSLMWNTPMGPLRFNFSRALVKEDFDKEQSFDVTVSTKF
ncbi:outer membrane protein assembly factor BamA [Xinfangfangia sp. CPCC 101601]|uniref:Outer membrane protein assembly factor BamA n=1 Tax=Pseudogemmobacter lacusdianii TaxID=3069608 RepID=A0ABU0W1X7_9RHOB|nr:outer membrane protein assembly factor BamA [Xinfangfangia sp. CPCC 101601]MDQ2068014.1 outer membrane protein assembly factor BamA [Xinfangfangia sp. CPCC 101601]